PHSPPAAPLCPYTTLFRSRGSPGAFGTGSGRHADLRGSTVRVRSDEDPVAATAAADGRRSRTRARAAHLPGLGCPRHAPRLGRTDRKSTRLNSSHVSNSYS